MSCPADQNGMLINVYSAIFHLNFILKTTTFIRIKMRSVWSENCKDFRSSNLNLNLNQIDLTFNILWRREIL